MTDGPLNGRVAIVTGSSRDMGGYTVAHLASLGAAVTVHYNSAADAANALADKIRADGGQAVTVKADLTTPDGAQHLIDETVAAHGGLDILVCNVGGFLKKPFEETTLEDWSWQFRLNTDSIFYCVKSALEHLKASGVGRIVTFSVAGADEFVHHKNFVAYAAAKAAVTAMSRSLAVELAPHKITVNVIAPGIVSDNAPTRSDAEAIGPVKHTPIGRVGAAQDVAEAVAFLVRPDADYITGTVMDVSGGWRL